MFHADYLFLSAIFWRYVLLAFIIQINIFYTRSSYHLLQKYIGLKMMRKEVLHQIGFRTVIG